MDAVKVVGTGAVVGGGGSVALGTAVSCAGFTTSGVAAGSVAAGIQSAIGVVEAGSAFATIQSIGATGALFASAPLVLVGGAIAGGIYWWCKKKDKK